MKQLAVIGENVTKYSLSPYVHNFWLNKYNLPHNYIACDVDRKGLAEFIKDARSKFFGFNVTTPFKNEILQYLDQVDEIGEKTESINVVKNINGKLYGYNTDMMAFTKQFNLKKKYQRIVILGLGGVTRSILFALINFFQSEEIYIISRKVTINNLEKSLSKKIIYSDYSNLPELLKTTNLLINTTPKDVIDEIINVRDLQNNVELFDVNYINTNFHDKLNLANIKVLKGNNMFVEQAKHSFDIWFNILPSEIDINELKIC